MNKYPRLKRFLLIGSFVIMVIVFVGLFILDQQAKTNPSALTPSFKDIHPGVTTKDEILKALGNPLEETKQGDQTNLIFENKGSINRRDQIILNKQNVVNFAIEIVSYRDPRKPKTMFDLYGKPSHTLFGEGAEDGFALYVYPEKGVAYIANQLDEEGNGVLDEIWYFEATTIENFRKQWAPDYVDNAQDLQQHGY